MNAHDTQSSVTQRATDSLAVSLRAFVTDPLAKQRRQSDWKPPGPSRWTLVLDTETTTDPSQRLRFGSYQLRKGEILDEAGLFFDPDPDALSPTKRRTLESFAASHGLKCMTHTEFVEEVFFRRGYNSAVRRETLLRTPLTDLGITEPCWLPNASSPPDPFRSWPSLGRAPLASSTDDKVLPDVQSPSRLGH